MTGAAIEDHLGVGIEPPRRNSYYEGKQLRMVATPADLGLP